jgi:hypothetical protein
VAQFRQRFDKVRDHRAEASRDLEISRTV